MGKRIGYGKLGRSMPLTLDGCGNLGGDVEMVAVVKTLALRHRDDTFILIGRNTGEDPESVGLPPNVKNPWTRWGPLLREMINAAGLNKGALTSEGQLQLREIFRQLTESTFLSLDGVVMWVGQHGTSNMPIPTVADPEQLTKPQDWCAYYASFILQGINAWRDVDPFMREEVWLNADSRNRHKMRDLKWPLQHPILTQYDFTHPLKHERYGDTRDPTQQVWALDWHWGKIANADNSTGSVWISHPQNVYSRLEINGLLPGTPFGDLVSYDENWDRPGNFGLFINEARRQVSESTKRLEIMKKWVLPLEPHFIHGTWTRESLVALDRVIEPAPWDQYFPKLHSVRATLTTPSSGSGFATAKPWEAFAGGTVCFFHPKYDDQDHILSDAPAALRDFLRVNSVDELRRKIQRLDESRELWLDVVHAQRAHFVTAVEELRYMNLIEERIYG